MISLPYMKAHKVRPGIVNPEIPLIRGIPMIIKPTDFAVVDGDTITSLTAPDENGTRQMGFSVRARSFDSPEKIKNTRSERAFAMMGAPSTPGRGDFARDFLKKRVAGRAVLIVPVIDSDTGEAKTEDHGRVLGDIYISGTPGDKFDIANAICLEDLMAKYNYATVNLQESRQPKRAYDALRKHQGPTADGVKISGGPMGPSF